MIKQVVYIASILGLVFVVLFAVGFFEKGSDMKTQQMVCFHHQADGGEVLFRLAYRRTEEGVLIIRFIGDRDEFQQRLSEALEGYFDVEWQEYHRASSVTTGATFEEWKNVKNDLPHGGIENDG